MMMMMMMMVLVLTLLMATLADFRISTELCGGCLFVQSRKVTS